MDFSSSSSQRLSRMARRYLRAVRHELCLPGKARKEALAALKAQLSHLDCSYPELISRMGSPLQAADLYNRSQDGVFYTKSLWRIPCLILGILGSLFFLLKAFGNELVYFLVSHQGYSLGQAYSIGVIGGADGPTSIFVSTLPDPSATYWYLIYLLSAVFGFLGYYYFRHKKETA